jgi:hypothetical protein
MSSILIIGQMNYTISTTNSEVKVEMYNIL